MEIEAAVWDMGGVILRTEDQSGRRQWERKLGLDRDELAQLVFEGEASRRASVGRAHAHEVWTSLADRFGLGRQELEQLEKDFWRGDRVDRELLTYIRDLQRHRKTALLSNAWPDVRQHIEDTWGFADAFDQIVISAEVGFVKPDPKIYQLTLDRLDTVAERSIFIDDFPENVEGARAVGMRALLFRSSEQVRRELDALLTPGSSD